MEDLQGKVAVVTGAASGMGLAFCRRFAAEGMKIVMADVEEPALKAAAPSVGDSADVLTVPTDVTDASQVEELARQAYDRFGNVHVLCNNAGVSVNAPLWEATLSDWRFVLGVNLWGVIHGIHAFVPRMIASGEPGHIVNTSSTNGALSYPRIGIYGASKAAVLTLTESLSMDLRVAGANIDVTVLIPSGVNTRLGESRRNRPSDLADTSHDSSFAAKTAEIMRNGTQPEEVAELVIDAIKTKRFYVYTSDMAKKMIATRFDDWINDRLPMPPATAPVKITS